MKRIAVRPPGRGARTFETVGSVVDQVFTALHLEQRFAAAAATDHWGEVVGPDVLKRTRCTGVRDRELLVEVQGAVWMGHLAVLRQGILESLNEKLPAEARLRAIRFVPMRSKEELRSERTP